jgi:hypothetical protein
MKRRLISPLLVIGFLAFASGNAAGAPAPQPGYQLFGQLTGAAISQSAQTDRPFGQEVSAEAPLDDALAFFRSILCGS